MILAIIMVIGCILWWIRTAWNLLTTPDDNWEAFLLSGACVIITAIETGAKYLES